VNTVLAWVFVGLLAAVATAGPLAGDRLRAGLVVFFVVTTTMVTAGIRGVVRWVADPYFGVGLAAGPNALAWEVVAGIALQFSFRRRGRLHGRFGIEGERA
jgi:hypothetical protein